MCVVGPKLVELLDSCTIMGTEALVEVHTPAELEYALARGATTFLVNMWDRLTGIHYIDQSKKLIGMMPINCVAIAGGDISSVDQILELGYAGYDGAVVGRHLADIGPIDELTEKVHNFRGPPRGPHQSGLMKGIQI